MNDICLLHCHIINDRGLHLCVQTVNFASDIGGILGLWIGCSIISLFEFLELSMDCIALAVMRLFRRRRPKRVDPVSPSVKPPGSRRQPTPYTDKVSVESAFYKGVLKNARCLHSPPLYHQLRKIRCFMRMRSRPIRISKLKHE